MNNFGRYYKLVAMEKDGNIVPKIKISDTEKNTDFMEKLSFNMEK